MSAEAESLVSFAGHKPRLVGYRKWRHERNQNKKTSTGGSGVDQTNEGIERLSHYFADLILYVYGLLSFLFPDDQLLTFS